MGRVLRGFFFFFFLSIPFIIILVISLDILFFAGVLQLPMLAYVPLTEGEVSVLGYTPEVEIMALIISINLGVVPLLITRCIKK